jgi:hypothetical protein
MRLVVVPTRDGAPTSLTVESAIATYQARGLRTIGVCCAEHGPDDALVSPSLLFFPSGAVKAFVKQLEELLRGSLESLFGHPSYHRSYGGAANLCSVLSLIAGADLYYRFDDDCDFSSTTFDTSARGEVIHGIYVGDDVHPRDVLRAEYSELIQALDPSRMRHWEERPKTGCLAVPIAAARAAPFPVWFDAVTGLKPRGEIFDWERSLRPSGFTFRCDRGFSVVHRGSAKGEWDWLLTLALKSECSFVTNWLAVGESGDLDEALRARRRQITGTISRSALAAERKERIREIAEIHAPRFAAAAIPEYIRARARWVQLMEFLGDPSVLDRLTQSGIVGMLSRYAAANR